MKQDSIIDSLLASAARGESCPWPQVEDAGAFADAVWERLQFHGLAALLNENSDALATWPLGLRTKLQDEARLQFFWEESHRATVVRLLQALAGAGIASIVLKGTALAYSVHAVPAARRRGDTDLLVRKTDLGEVRKQLEATGFERNDDPHGLFFQETWLCDTGIGLVHAVDLHWQVSDSPVLQSVLRSDEFFDQALPLPKLHETARMAPPVLSFMQGAMNQAWHRLNGYIVEDVRMFGGGRLIWALDNHLLASRFTAEDWTRLADLAIERGAGNICLAALRDCIACFNTNVPTEIMARFEAGPAETEVDVYLGMTDGFALFRRNLLASRGLANKVRFLGANLLPDARHLRRKYPKSASWPVPLLHVRRIIGNVGRMALGRSR